MSSKNAFFFVMSSLQKQFRIFFAKAFGTRIDPFFVLSEYIFRKNTARSPDCITKPIASRERRFHFLPCIQRATSRGSHLLRTCLFHYCPRIGHDERKLFFNTKQGVWQITKESFAFIWVPPRRNNIPRVSGMQIATCKTLGIVLRKFPSSVS